MLEKKGLKLFNSYQNAECAINNTTKTSSGLRNQSHGLCASQSNILNSPPTPCKGHSFQTGHHRFVQTTAEVNNLYFEAKSVIPNGVVKNDHKNFSMEKDKDCKRIICCGTLLYI